MLDYVTAYKIFSIYKNVFNCPKISPFYGEIKPNFPSRSRQMEKLRLNVNWLSQHHPVRRLETAGVWEQDGQESGGSACFRWGEFCILVTWLLFMTFMTFLYMTSSSLLFTVIVIFTSASAQAIQSFTPSHTHYTPLQTIFRTVV